MCKTTALSQSQSNSDQNPTSLQKKTSFCSKEPKEHFHGEHVLNTTLTPKECLY